MLTTAKRIHPILNATMSIPTMAADSLFDITKRFFPSTPLQSSPSGTEPTQLSQGIFPHSSYTDNEKVEITQWIATSSRLAARDEDEAKHADRLSSLNTHLSTRTTRLAPTIAKWTSEERTGEHGYHHIVRHLDFVQHAPHFGLSLDEKDKVSIDTNDVRFVPRALDAKEEKERKKKEKAHGIAASNVNDQKRLVMLHTENDTVQEHAGSTGESTKAAEAGEPPAQPRKEKKEKAPKAAKQPPKESPISPNLIDLRVGHILKAINHPNAESLYVSTISCGDPPGTENTSEYEGIVVRTVCSGLKGLIPLTEMQDRKIVVVCNLKPVKMRGVLSSAMVLAASPRLADGEEDKHAGPVELVSPPANAKAGERIYFEGWEGEPEGVLNPKKKVWETLQPGFTTTEDLGVAFEMGRVEQLAGEAGQGKPAMGRLVAKSGGDCKVASLKGALVR